MIDLLLQKARKYNVQRHIRGIESRDFSLIASNCTGTLPYRFLDMPHLSPTVNLFFFAPDYLKFASRLEHYLNQPMGFIATSKYQQGRATHEGHGRYPIGLLDDIEVHFMHYSSEADAVDKWHRRAARVNFDNLIFTFTDRDLCTPELIQQFNELPGRKLMLTARPLPWVPCAVPVPAYRGLSEVGDAYTRYDHLTHVNYRGLIDGARTSSALSDSFAGSLNDSVTRSTSSVKGEPALARTISS